MTDAFLHNNTKLVAIILLLPFAKHKIVILQSVAPDLRSYQFWQVPIKYTDMKSIY